MEQSEERQPSRLECHVSWNQATTLFKQMTVLLLRDFLFGLCG
jgi:hypothetical protein